MNRILLPKLANVLSVDNFLRQLYLGSQCNKTTDPLWVGAAVILNVGADNFIQNHHANACWFSLYESTVKSGGLDGRIGVVVQFEDQRKVDLMRKIFGVGVPGCPWVRVTCHLEDRDNICHVSSVVLDARLCTTIPQSFYQAAKEQVLGQENMTLNAISQEFN